MVELEYEPGLTIQGYVLICHNGVQILFGLEVWLGQQCFPSVLQLTYTHVLGLF